MEKREIYEHLAKIYLDASSRSEKKRKKSKKFPTLNYYPLWLTAVLILAISLPFFIFWQKSQAKNTQIALVICPEAVKINFHFDPAKKEIYSVDLKGLDLRRYRTLGFSLKKSDYSDTINLRVEFIGAFREKSEIYLKNISAKWQDYKINFSEFKKISGWSRMVSLNFIVEEWNSRQKNGVVYVDNVRVLH